MGIQKGTALPCIHQGFGVEARATTAAVALLLATTAITLGLPQRAAAQSLPSGGSSGAAGAPAGKQGSKDDAQHKVEGAEELPNSGVRVLQNRYFLKAMRPELNVFAGSVLNESYSRTIASGVRAGVFFTEALGVEYSFNYFSPSDSADLSALKKIEYCTITANGNRSECKKVVPSFVRLTSSHGLVGTFAPIYGKVNLLDWSIVYSDIYLMAGYGLLAWQRPSDGENGTNNSAQFGIGQRFYFAKSFNVRFDAIDHLFYEERENLGQKSTSLRHAWSVTVGFSAFLWDKK